MKEEEVMVLIQQLEKVIGNGGESEIKRKPANALNLKESLDVLD